MLKNQEPVVMGMPMELRYHSAFKPDDRSVCDNNDDEENRRCSNFMIFTRSINGIFKEKPFKKMMSRAAKKENKTRL